jgi:DNA (cytosine-5)-methyltransferase 1
MRRLQKAEVGKMRTENTQLTLGSLFDGIGGYPLAGMQAGIRPVWASEIQPFRIRDV